MNGSCLVGEFYYLYSGFDTTSAATKFIVSASGIPNAVMYQSINIPSSNSTGGRLVCTMIAVTSKRAGDMLPNDEQEFGWVKYFGLQSGASQYTNLGEYNDSVPSNVTNYFPKLSYSSGKLTFSMPSGFYLYGTTRAMVSFLHPGHSYHYS